MKNALKPTILLRFLECSRIILLAFAGLTPPSLFLLLIGTAQYSTNGEIGAMLRRAIHFVAIILAALLIVEVTIRTLRNSESHRPQG